MYLLLFLHQHWANWKTKAKCVWISGHILFINDTTHHIVPTFKVCISTFLIHKKKEQTDRNLFAFFLHVYYCIGTYMYLYENVRPSRLVSLPPCTWKSYKFMNHIFRWKVYLKNINQTRTVVDFFSKYFIKSNWMDGEDEDLYSWIVDWWNYQ